MGSFELKLTDIKKFLQFSRIERTVLVQAFFLNIATAIVLRCFGLNWAKAALVRIAKDKVSSNEGNRRYLSRDSIVHLLDISIRRSYIQPSCLTQSLVLWTLLHRHGVGTELWIGVIKDGDALKAHAWIEHDGKVLNDAPGGPSFAPFDRAILASSTES